jgi:hypothetical protein
MMGGNFTARSCLMLEFLIENPMEACTLGMAHTHSFALPLRWRTGPHLSDSFA